MDVRDDGLKTQEESATDRQTDHMPPIVCACCSRSFGEDTDFQISYQ